MWPLKVGAMKTNSLGQQLGGREGRGRAKSGVGSSNWHHKGLQLLTLYKYIYTPIHTIYIHGYCVCYVYSIKPGSFTSSSTEIRWRKLHIIPLVLCWSTRWFVQSENHSCTADFPQGPQRRGDPGEIRHSPFIECALLFWGGPATFLSCCCAPAVAWYAAAFGFDGTF